MAESNGARKGLGAILVDCAIAALITFVIAAPIMGLRTVNSPGGMTLQQHWGKVLTAVAVVFFGRLALQLFVWNRSAEGSGFGQLVLRLALSALNGFAVGTAVCFLTLGADNVSLGTAMENALLTMPWNAATLLFSLAVFSMSYGFFPRQAAPRETAEGASMLEPLGD